MSGRLTSIVVSSVALASVVCVLQHNRSHDHHDSAAFSSHFRRRRRLRTDPAPPVVEDTDPGAPKLAWLMSFPDSGTTFTSTTIQAVSQRGTASNYGNMFMHPSGEVVRDLYASVPVYSNRPNGPFLFSNLPLPSEYILTKTHCGGHCSDCYPGHYMFGPNQFVKQCHTSSRFNPEKARENPSAYPFEHPQYDPSMVKKAVHLIRNPFDNVVSRFHHEYKMAVAREDNDWTSNYSYNSKGFHSWCDFQADKYREEETKWFTEWTGRSDFMEVAKHVPCHAEFLKYVRWHNHAFYTTDEALKIPTLVVHYENFATDFDGTLDKLLKFYELPAEGDPREFHFHTYPYYTDEERAATTEFLRILAAPALWENLRPYVWKTDDDVDVNDGKDRGSEEMEGDIVDNGEGEQDGQRQ